MEKITLGDVTLTLGFGKGEGGIDSWWKRLLSRVETPYLRSHLYGADAGRCARLNFFHAYNETVPAVQNSASTAYMAIGVALENMLRDALQRDNRLIASNYRIPQVEGIPISGKVDLIAVDNSERVSIFEVKTCSALPKLPKWVHLQQLQTYAAVTGFDRAFLTYISRGVQSTYGGGLDILTFQIDTSRSSLYDRLLTAAISNLAIPSGFVPPMQPTFRKSVECLHCPFIPVCWEGAEYPLSEMAVTSTLYLELKTQAESLAETAWETRSDRFQGVLAELLSDFSSPATLPYLKTELKTALGKTA